MFYCPLLLNRRWSERIHALQRQQQYPIREYSFLSYDYPRFPCDSLYRNILYDFSSTLHRIPYYDLLDSLPIWGLHKPTILYKSRATTTSIMTGKAFHTSKGTLNSEQHYAIASPRQKQLLNVYREQLGCEAGSLGPWPNNRVSTLIEPYCRPQQHILKAFDLNQHTYNIRLVDSKLECSTTLCLVFKRSRPGNMAVIGR